MTKDEYINLIKTEDDWAPGWDAIDAEFNRLYPGQEPVHFGTEIASRAIFGGNNYLDGYSIFSNDNGYKHIVTYGMSCLYSDQEAYGGDYSGWGYEMTMKLKADNVEDCMWAINLLSNIARYTYTSNRNLEVGECIPGNGTPIRPDIDTKITALVTAYDTLANTLDTVHGKCEFIQIVGITERELDAIREDKSNINRLIDSIRNNNPDLVLDLMRRESYL